MNLMQPKRFLAFFLALGMVLGLIIVPKASDVYAGEFSEELANSINNYYNTSENKVLDHWEELASIYAYLEGQEGNDYNTGVDISDYILPDTGTGAGGLFTALMKGDEITAAALAGSLVADGEIVDPGYVSTYAVHVLALEAYNRSTGVVPVAYSTAGAIEHLLSEQDAEGGYSSPDWYDPALYNNDYDTAGLVLTVFSLPTFAGYPDIEAEKSNILNWIKAGQSPTGAFAAFGSDNANSTACVLYGLASLGEDLSTWTTSPAIGLISSDIYTHTDGWFTTWSGAWNEMATRQATLALAEIESGKSFYANIKCNAIHYISSEMQLVEPDGLYVAKAITVPVGTTLNEAASLVSDSVITGGFNYYEDASLLAMDSTVSDCSRILAVADNFSDITYFSYDGSDVGVPEVQVAFGAAADLTIKNLVLSTGEITSLPYVSVDINADAMGDVVADASGSVSIIPIHPVTNLNALEFTWDDSTFSNIRRIPEGSAILPALISMASGGTQTKTVSVRVEGPTANIVYYSAYDVTGDGSNQLVAGDAVTQVLSAAGKTYTYSDGYLSAVDGIFAGSYDPNFYDGWVYYINGLPGLGLGGQTISDGDEIVVYYGYYPGWGTDLVSLESTVIDGSVTLKVMNGQMPVSGVIVNWNGQDLPQTTDEQGQIVIDNVSTGTYSVQIFKADMYGVPQVVRFPANTTVIVTGEGDTAQGGGGGQTETAKKVFLSVKGLNGVTVLSKTGQTYYVGITARDVLDNTDLTITGSGNYVSAINGLEEFDYGPGSGWLYKVNGTLYGSTPADDYKLDIDDEVLWYYTSDYTSDRDVTDFLSEVEEEPEGEIVPEVVAVNGVADVTIAALDIKNAIQYAEESGSGKIVIAPEFSGNISQVNINMPVSSISEMLENSNVSLQIETEIGDLLFSGEALSAISAETGSMVSFSIEMVDKEALSQENQALIADRPVVSLSVFVDGKSVSEFGDGIVTVSLPYTLSEGEDSDAIVVYYIDEDGELKAVRSAYNEEAGTVVFTVNHFSNYAVGYNKVSFADVVPLDWYSKAVTFLAAREITTGVSVNVFAPNATLTRGQFIVMLMRAYGIEPLDNAADNFADAGDTYYTGHLAAAKKLEISNGIGDNNFAPDKQISRQDMFTLLYRALRVLNEKPEPGTADNLAAFSDSVEIADYARQAMETLVANGIISGNQGKLSPKGLTTRAQMAQVLYNLLSE